MAAFGFVFLAAFFFAAFFLAGLADDLAFFDLGAAFFFDGDFFVTFFAFPLEAFFFVDFFALAFLVVDFVFDSDADFFFAAAFLPPLLNAAAQPSAYLSVDPTRRIDIFL